MIIYFSDRSVDTDEMPAVSVSSLPEEQALEEDDDDSMNRESCHDSGIDIRESLPLVPPPLPAKKVSFLCKSLFVSCDELLNLLSDE